MINSQFLALDFDGVIADSIDECLVTAHNSYTKYLDLYSPRFDLQDFDSEDITRFRELRPLIRRGEDYVFLLQAMHESVELVTQNDFDNFLDENDERRASYRNVFYTVRIILQEEKPKEWLGLNPLYPGMSEFLRARLSAGNTVIVTTKDLLSVQLLLRDAGVEFDPMDLFQATRDLRKPSIINDILNARHWDPDQTVFIDDHVATVLEVNENIPVTSVCASWGYNTEEQQDIIRDAGLEVLELNEFFERYSK